MRISPGPLVSIVIPTYNCARDLERALTSVRAQTHLHWEALVVDNHSSDDTEERVHRFGDSRIKLFKIHNDGVIARSRNLALDHAQGEYVAFLDADDWWLPRKLAISLAYLEQGADVVYHDLLLVTKPRQAVFVRKARTRALTSPVYGDLLLGGNALTNSSVVVRRSLLAETGRLSEDPRLIAMEDYDLWLRLARITERFSRIPQALGYYWAGGGNTSNPVRVLNNIAAIQEQHAGDLSALAEGHNVYWMKYAAGKAQYRLGRYAMAQASCRSMSLQGAPLRIRLRVNWMLLAIRLFHNSQAGFSAG